MATMRRHYKVLVRSTIAPALSVTAYARVDGDPVPGATVQVSASVPNTPTDQVPDSWNRLSSPRTATVNTAWELVYSGANNSGSVSGSIRVSPDFASLSGSGSVRFRVWGMTFASPVSIAGVLFRTEELPGTPSVPVEPGTPGDVPAKFGTSLLWPAADRRRKGSGIGVMRDGTIIDFLYDDESRHDTWVRVNGKAIDHVDAETGNVFFTPDERVWVTFEKGIRGRPSELIGKSRLRDLGFDVHYCGCGLSLGGEPFFFDCAKGQSPVVKNVAGTVVAQLPGQGIPYDAEVDPLDSRAAYVTIQDGAKNGVAHTKSKMFVPGDARAIVAYRGQVLVGVSGYVKALTGSAFSAWSPVSHRLGDSVDAMCVDGRGILWISTSGPDALFALLPSGALVKVDSFEDDPDGGALFRTDVEAGGPDGNTVVWGRNNKRAGSRWEMRKVVPLTSGAGGAPVPADADILAGATWLGKPDAGKYPVVASGTMKRVGSTTHFRLSRAFEGRCVACVFVRRGGVLIGGAYDGCDSGETLVVKSRGNIIGGTKGGPLPARYGPTDDESYNRAYLKLRPGEEYWQCIVDEENKKRTSAIPGVWEE